MQVRNSTNLKRKASKAGLLTRSGLKKKKLDERAKNEQNKSESSSEAPKKSDKKFACVSWHKGKQKYYASFQHHGASFYIGVGLDPVLLAQKVNKKCAELNIPLKNPNLIVKKTRQTKTERTSIYKNVYLNTRPSVKQWMSKICKDRKIHTFGGFATEIEAARAVNDFCEKNGIPPKNPQILDHQSKFIGVSFYKAIGRYRAQITYKHKNYSCGRYDNEMEAALAVNARCREMGIPVKNPQLEIKQEKNRQKKFTCVYFKKEVSKYLAQIAHGNKTYNCGRWRTELEAAQAVNAKCIEFGIALKNPEAGLPENKPQNINESLNVGEEKLKVCFSDTDGDQIVLKFKTENKLWEFFVNGISKIDNCSISMHLKSGKITVKSIETEASGHSFVPCGFKSTMYKQIQAICPSKRNYVQKTTAPPAKKKIILRKKVKLVVTPTKKKTVLRKKIKLVAPPSPAKKKTVLRKKAILAVTHVTKKQRIRVQKNKKSVIPPKKKKIIVQNKQKKVVINPPKKAITRQQKKKLAATRRRSSMRKVIGKKSTLFHTTSFSAAQKQKINNGYVKKEDVAPASAPKKVNSILKYRRLKNGKNEYLVCWDYGSGQDTWVSEQNIDDAQAMEDFQIQIEIGIKEIAKKIRGTFNGETNYVKNHVDLGKEKHIMLEKLKQSLEKEINKEMRKLNLFSNKKCFPNMKDLKEHVLKQYGDQFDKLVQQEKDIRTKVVNQKMEEEEKTVEKIFVKEEENRGILSEIPSEIPSDINETISLENQFETEYKELKNNYFKLELEHSNFKTENAKLEEQINKLKKQNLRLEEEKSILKEEKLDEKEHKLKEKEERLELKEEITQLQDEIKKLREEVSVLR